MILFVAVALFGQTPLTTITGTVTDPAGTLFTGTMFIRSPDHTDNDGVKVAGTTIQTTVSSGAIRVSLPPSMIRTAFSYEAFGTNNTTGLLYSAHWMPPIASAPVDVNTILSSLFVSQVQKDGSYQPDPYAALNTASILYPTATAADALALAQALASRVAYWAVQTSPIARGTTRFVVPGSYAAFGDFFNIVQPVNMNYPQCFTGRIWYNTRVDGTYPWSIPQGGLPSCGNSQVVMGGSGSSYSAGQIYQLNPAFMLSNPDMIDSLAKQMAYGYLDNAILGLYAQMTSNSPVGLPGTPLSTAVIASGFQTVTTGAFGTAAQRINFIARTGDGGGTVNLTSGTGAVVGAGTAFASTMIGYSISIATSVNTSVHTTITAVADTTHLTVANTSTTVSAGANYSIYTGKINQAGTVTNDASGNLTGVGTSFNADLIGQWVGYGTGNGQVQTVTDATHMKLNLTGASVQSGVIWNVWMPLMQPGSKVTMILDENQIPLLMQGTATLYPGLISQMSDGRPHVIPDRTFAGTTNVPGTVMELSTSAYVQKTGSAPVARHGVAFGPHCFLFFSAPPFASNINPVTGATSTTFNYVASPPINGFVATIAYSLAPSSTGTPTNNYTFSFNPNLGSGLWQNSECVRVEH